MIVTVHHIRKKDLVQVMSGSEKGKTGKILRVIQKKGKVLIEKINMIQRHTKATGKTPGGRIEKEAALFASCVLLYCEKCARGVRTFMKLNEKGKKQRHCKKCQNPIDK